jgi:hypothetical protein
MIVVSRSAHIAAPVERVFALMADPLARSRLSPVVEPIRAEIETGTPLRKGSVCHFRLNVGNRIIDYRTRVQEFTLDRLIVSVSDSAVPFEARMETRPEGDGTRLTLAERFEPTDEMLREAVPDGASGGILHTAMKILMFVDTDSAISLRERQEGALTKQLEGNMERWLAAIKRYLEGGDSD